jgi:hypothetical protein
VSPPGCLGVVLGTARIRNALRISTGSEDLLEYCRSPRSAESAKNKSPWDSSQPFAPRHPDQTERRGECGGSRYTVAVAAAIVDVTPNGVAQGASPAREGRKGLKYRPEPSLRGVWRCVAGGVKVEGREKGWRVRPSDS